MANEPPIGEDDIQAYVDGRLAPDRGAIVEHYLSANPSIKSAVEAQRADRDALRQQLSEKFAEPIPSRLRIANIESAKSTRRASTYRSIAAGVAMLALGSAGGWLARGATTGQPPSPNTVAFTGNAIDAFKTYVVEIAHPVEVSASDEAHLVKWLSNRSGRNLTPPDLSGFGYRLVGGRVLPGGGAAAAQLMYEDAKGTRLAVYLRSGEGSQTAFTFVTDDGVSTFTWVDQGYDFAVSAPVDRDILLPIARAVYEKTL